MKRTVRSIFFTLVLLIAPILASATSVNINTADADTMATQLKGIGQSKAMAIVSYREKHGKFTSIEQLSQVSGIGEKTVNKLKPQLSIK